MFLNKKSASRSQPDWEVAWTRLRGWFPVLHFSLTRLHSYRATPRTWRIPPSAMENSLLGGEFDDFVKLPRASSYVGHHHHQLPCTFAKFRFLGVSPLFADLIEIEIVARNFCSEAKNGGSNERKRIENGIKGVE